MTINSQSGPRTSRPPDDLITTATSALRRLHFKSGRVTARNPASKGQPVPKVIVMGSSTASETTINTSTDSSNTMVTTMTSATEGEATEDSLEMTEPIDFLNTENIFDGGKSGSSSRNLHHQILQPIPATPRTPITARQQTPPTATKQETRFSFDVVSLQTVLQQKPHSSNETGGSNGKSIQFQLQEGRRSNSYRMAQDLGVEDGGLRRSSATVPMQERRPSCRRKSAANVISPMKKQHINHTPVTSGQYRKLSSPPSHQSVSLHTANLPDLRVDFFNETSMMDRCQTIEGANKKVGAANVDPAANSLGTIIISTATSTTTTRSTAPINVTANPLENSVHLSSTVRTKSKGKIVAGRPSQATIVVQQPSLTNDQTNVSTVLIKNGVELTSGSDMPTTNRRTSKKFKEDNMKQLLDVTNTLTIEEIHDFEMKYGSPHHNRSQSMKTPGRSSGRPNYLCLPQQRSRVASMPNTGFEEEYYRLRHFSITGKGVINRGDSLKSRRSRSNTSVASSNSSTEQLPGAASAAESARTSGTCSLASSRESSTSVAGTVPYKVLMLGGPAVGKSSLVSQFMTSEYLHAYDTSIDDESGEKSVSVLLAGEESEMTFIDFSTADLSPDSCINKYNEPNAYCVVYSCSDRASLLCAEKILQTLWSLDTISTRAVILVANKADLVRSKTVSTEEGKSVATAYDCKFIETSVSINHNVDELLVGILTQIRLKLENPEKSRDLFRKRTSSKKYRNLNRSPVSSGNTPITSTQNSPKKYRGSRTSASLKVKNLLGKVWARDSKSKSCENLHVL